MLFRSDLMLGYYGTTQGEKNAEVLAQAEAQQQKPAITERPANLLAPEWDKLRAETEALEGNNGSDEDVLTYAMFPQVSTKFFKTRHEGAKSQAKDPEASRTTEPAKPAAGAGGGAGGDARKDPVTYVVTLNGREHQVRVSPAA